MPGVQYLVESWVDHDLTAAYDAITCIEATEHLASDRLDADAKVEVYRAFFERCAGWLRAGRTARAATDLSRQRRTRGQPRGPRRRLRADSPRHLSRVHAGVAVGARARLGDRTSSSNGSSSTTPTTGARFGPGAWPIGPLRHAPVPWSAMRQRGRSPATSPPARSSSGCARTRSTGSFCGSARRRRSGPDCCGRPTCRTPRNRRSPPRGQR